MRLPGLRGARVKPMPGEDSKVVVLSPLFGKLEARVARAQGESLVLEFTLPPKAGALSRPSRVSVAFTNHEGFHKLIGSIVAEGGRGGARFTVKEHRSEEQRRKHVRVPCHLRMTVYRGGSATPPVITHTKDLSAGGTLVADEGGRLPIGTAVRLAIWLTGEDAPVKAIARVVRRVGQTDKGLRIEKITVADEKRITAYIRSRERELKTSVAEA